MLLKHYLDQGVSKAELSQRFGVNRRTIHNWVKTGQLDRDLSAGARGYSPRPPASHKLDPFKAIIDARLEAFPKLSAKRLFVRFAPRATRPHEPVEAPVRFETPAGQQGQVDFGTFTLPWGRRHALVIVLGNRRGRAPTSQRLCGGAAMKPPAPSRRDRLRAMLADLKMPGALEAVGGILSEADGGTISASEAIEQLLNAQIVLRNNRRLQTAMRSSRLPAVKTLDQFDFAFQPSIKREQVESLHELSFLERGENVILLGPPGVGKTLDPADESGDVLR